MHPCTGLEVRHDMPEQIAAWYMELFYNSMRITVAEGVALHIADDFFPDRVTGKLQIAFVAPLAEHKHIIAEKLRCHTHIIAPERFRAFHIQKEFIKVVSRIIIIFGNKRFSQHRIVRR